MLLVGFHVIARQHDVLVGKQGLEVAVYQPHRCVFGAGIENRQTVVRASVALPVFGNPPPIEESLSGADLVRFRSVIEVFRYYIAGGRGRIQRSIHTCTTKRGVHLWQQPGSAHGSIGLSGFAFADGRLVARVILQRGLPGGRQVKSSGAASHLLCSNSRDLAARRLRYGRCGEQRGTRNYAKQGSTHGSTFLECLVQPLHERFQQIIQHSTFTQANQYSGGHPSANGFILQNFYALWSNLYLSEVVRNVGSFIDQAVSRYSQDLAGDIRNGTLVQRREGDVDVQTRSDTVNRLHRHPRLD